MNLRVVLFLVFTFGLALQGRSAIAEDYTPMKVIQTDAIVFPRRATELGIRTGEVHVSVEVDEKGKLSDILVTGYTHPLLAETAVQALKRWQYEPAWLHGQARSATIALVFTFESQGMVVVDMNVNSYVAMRDLAMRPNAYTYSARTLRQLDRIPTPTKVVQPINPQNPANRNPVAVTVVFFIDEKGTVRLPAVSRETSETADQFAAAALAAVSQWQFEPPLSQGQPVLVAARQEFKFRPLPPK
ncbi:MAG: TonB family protein [Opitutus sp.]